jgi:hypothetical protein
MELKDIYIEFGKSVVILATLYIPAMLIEGIYNITDWSGYTRIGVALLYTYFHVVIYDYTLNGQVLINSKVYKYIKDKVVKLKVTIIRDFNKLKQWH